MMDRPLFEVTTPAANAAARRLTTAAKITTALRLASGTDTTILEGIIDSVSAECARHCKLARPASWATPPTFGQEVVKATWLATNRERTSKLLLPWRLPISAIGQVVEDGTNLTVNVDFRLIGGAMLERLLEDAPVCWSIGKLVVPYTTGWSLPTDVPAELEGRVIEQVKMLYLGTDQNPALRSESVPEVYQASYSVAGGDSIGESGLLVSLESVLDPFRDKAT